MNYLRHDGAYVSLKTIDKNKNAKEYLDFKVMKGKTEEEAKEALNNLAIKDHLAIIENDTGKFVGTIGFDNIVQSNQRANISFDFSEEVNGNKTKKILYGQKAIRAMTRYAFESLNLRNVLAEIPANDETAVELFRDLDLYDYIGTRSFSKKAGDELYGTHMFEEVPYGVNLNKGHLLLPENKVLVYNQERNIELENMKKELNGSSFKLIDPETYEEDDTNYLQEIFGKSLNEANLATEIGFYKTTFNDYRLSKKFKGPNKYDYLIVHNDGKVIGYVEKLHNDPSNLATDIDVAIIDKNYKNKDIESEALKIYSDELRRIGYVSIASIGFNYSDDSLLVRKNAGFEKYANRTEAYFGLGKLQDMSYFEKTFDDDIGKSFVKKYPQ